MRIVKILSLFIVLTTLLFSIIIGAVIIEHTCEAKKNLSAQHKDTRAIVCFIDDDSGKYVPEIWGPIIDSTKIKMGFACITGYMEGQVPYSEVFEQMDSSYLRKLYNDGHDVYSHAYFHQEFYVDTVTIDMIDYQCRKSQDWLISNGYLRNSDMIVYPGGLGRGSWGGAKKHNCLI